MAQMTLEDLLAKKEGQKMQQTALVYLPGLGGELEIQRIDQMIEQMTDEQAYRLMSKAERYVGSLAEPDWSKREGHWQRATAAGVVDGTDPERPMKRDEVVAVLGRKGLL